MRMGTIGLALLVGCGATAAPPVHIEVAPPPVARPSNGWCASRPVRRGPPARSMSTFSIDVTNRVVESITVDPEREGLGRSRHDGSEELGFAGYVATLDGGEIALTRPAYDCEQTDMGCFGRATAPVAPAEVVLRDRAAEGACIAFFERLPGGWMLGFEDEIRAYPENLDGAPVPRFSLAAPRLRPIANIDGTLVLSSDRPGPLWIARWGELGTSADEAGEPTLATSRAHFTTPVESVVDSYLADRLLLAFAGDELVALDRATLARRWQVRGDVRAFMVDHVTQAVLAVRIERFAADRARVVLVLLHGDGRFVDEYVVYEDAGIVEVWIGRVDNTPIVHVARADG